MKRVKNNIKIIYKDIIKIFIMHNKSLHDLLLNIRNNIKSNKINYEINYETNYLDNIIINNNLQNFLKHDTNIISYKNLLDYLNTYIHENNLIDINNNKIIKPDLELKKLFNLEDNSILTIVNIGIYLNKLLI